MNDLTPDEWAYWQAEYRLHPWGNDYERTSLLLANLINTMQGLVPRQEGDDLTMLPNDLFVPFRTPKDSESDAIESAYEGLSALRGLDGSRL